VVLKIKLEKLITAGNVLIKSILLPPVERSSSIKKPNINDKIGIKINITFFDVWAFVILYYLID
tara:strand:+ start:273 stop:464 length:192 start_codon:yes stop_codon:yes gene_type:complete